VKAAPVSCPACGHVIYPVVTGGMIREFRLAHGIRQSDVARAIGKTSSYISDMERGSREVSRDFCDWYLAERERKERG